jgi:hypothetical protein
MIRPNMAGLRLAVLLAVSIAWTPAWSAETARGTLSPDEVAKQKAIYDSKGDATPDGYVVGRTLLSYTYILLDEFKRSLGSLGGKDRWLDIGAGEGRAILDYCMSRYDAVLHAEVPPATKKARAVAMSIEDRRTPMWHQTATSLEPNHIQYVFGKPLRQYTTEELGGRFQVITDVLGGFSYAQDLTIFMEKTLSLLDVNGSFYTVLQDVRTETGTNKPFYPDARFLTEIADADGSEVRMCTWLKSISCVEVTCEAKGGWKPPLEIYRVKKVCENVTVPRMTPVHFQAGTPPERGYRLQKQEKREAAAQK